MSEQTDLFGGDVASTRDASMARDAVISPCGTYRYRLTRSWDATLPTLGWIMLNPSTADASVDDPTIRKCVGFARRGGFGSIVVTNLFAFRATDPKELKRRASARPHAHVGPGRPAPARRDRISRDITTIVGPENDTHILAAVREAKTTILAWGAHGDLGCRDSKVLLMLERAKLDAIVPGGEFPRFRTAVLAYTNDKSKPRHPLYLKYELIDALAADLARAREVRR